MSNPFETLPSQKPKEKENGSFEVKVGDFFEFADSRGTMRRWKVSKVDLEGKTARMETTGEDGRRIEGNMTFSGLEKARETKEKRDKIPSPRETVIVHLENGSDKRGVVVDIDRMRKTATVKIGNETAGVDLSQIERIKEAA